MLKTQTVQPDAVHSRIVHSAGPLQISASIIRVTVKLDIEDADNLTSARSVAQRQNTFRWAW